MGDAYIFGAHNAGNAHNLGGESMTSGAVVAQPSSLALSGGDWYAHKELGVDGVLDSPTVRDRDPAPARFKIGNVMAIVVNGPIPTWIPPTVARLNTLLDLPENWDLQGAARIDRAVIPTVLRLLTDAASPNMPVPDLVPTVEGGIQVEWHTRGIDLEIEAARPDELIVVFEDHQTNIAFDGEFPPHSIRVRNAIQQLSRRA
jgi:hypothetical protein